MHFRNARRSVRHAAAALTSCACGSRKRLFLLLLMLVGVSVTILLMADSRLEREDRLDLKLVEMQNEIQYLKSRYQSRQEDIIKIQLQVSKNGNQSLLRDRETTIAPEVAAILGNNAGSRIISGLNTKTYLSMPTSYHLLPHLMKHKKSLQPAFHMRGSRNFVDYVIGIPTVRRDKESYILITLGYLLAGLEDKYENSTLVVICVGETDLEFVLHIAQMVESKFPKFVENGMIEVISPSLGYYPNLSDGKPTLGDSARRYRWRTKQNLDAIFLMAYAQTKGTYFLMLEDDIVCEPTYMSIIKNYTSAISLSNPEWIFIEYCPVGGIGKLFKSAYLSHFIVYVQLFYRNMPIDWILEKYLDSMACSFDMKAKECAKTKLGIRPKHAKSLFQHIGLYSSLRGKIQKVDDVHSNAMPKYFPHSNPPLETAITTIATYGKWNLTDAYLGKNFFWGIKPKKGDLIEFILKKPMYIKSFLFRSGNVEHILDRLLHTEIEVTLDKKDEKIIPVGSFDEFGFAEGTIKRDIGPIKSVRLKVKQNLNHWVILSEISLTPSESQ